VLKIRTKEEFEKLVFEGKIPTIIANQVCGDLLMFGEYLVEEYEHNDKSAVVIVDKDEFELLAAEYKISLDEYEYKDVIGVNNEYYIEKLLFIKNNGETGVIVYKVHHFGKTLERFDNEMYVTKLVKEKLNNGFIFLLKSMIEESRVALKGNLDYLQIFDITNIGNNTLKIAHLQEVPKNSKVYYVPDFKCEDCKLYWISEVVDNKEYSTLLFAEEY
jgi:hypothetical protein